MDDVQDSLIVLFKTIDQLLETNIKEFVTNKKSHRKKTLQLFNTVKFTNPTCSACFEIILSHCLKSETTAPGSFLECISKTSSFFKQFLTGNTNQLVSKKLDGTSFYGEPLSYIGLQTLIQMNVDSKFFSSLITEAIDLAGFMGKIFVEKSMNSTTSIEKTNGYKFKTKPLFQSQKTSNARVVCIDGYVDSVSQANLMFEDAVDIKENCVMFVRGISDDVLTTIKTNNRRGVMNVIPIIIDFDLRGINMLNDISVVCGCELISCNKGDLINLVGFRQAPRVDMISFFSDFVLVANKRTTKSVFNHVMMLKNKRNISDAIDVSELIDLRIKCLNSNHVTIRLVDDSDFIKNSQMIDNVLRQYKSALSHGLVEGNKLAASDVTATYHAITCIETLTNVGAHVMVL